MKKKEKKAEEKQEKVLEENTNLPEEQIEITTGGVKEEEQKDEKTLLEERIKELEEENKKLIEKNKLAQAETINYRRRKDEETAQIIKYANQDIILEFIIVKDNLERAIKDDDKESEEVKKYKTGIKMIVENINCIFNKFGVEEINRVGQIFDPQQEQAMVTDSIEELEDEEVIEVLLKGYKLKDRVIRPASVKINQK